MRLTNNLMTRSYLANLNDSLSSLNSLNVSVAAGRKYMKASEDPATALKAFEVRRNLSRNSVYKENIESAQDLLTQKESTISTINEIVGNAATQVLQGKSDTYNAASRKVIADTLRSYQEQILTSANAKFSGDYIFGGADVEHMPFTVVSGKLLYKGQDVDTGTFTDETRYLDIGMGIQTDVSGKIIPDSAFNTANSGIELLGSGEDANGISGNLYNLLGQIADKFENNDMTDIDKYSQKLDDCKQSIILQYTSVGEKSKFVDFLKTRFDDNESISLEEQKNLEGIDTAQGIIDFNQQKFAYNACLQKGLNILQPSLLDYLK